MREFPARSGFPEVWRVDTVGNYHIPGTVRRIW